jgi:hypothetical protein
MNLLVGIHIGSDWNAAGINAAQINLDDNAIKHIFKLAKIVKKGQAISEYDYSPELGTSHVNLQNESPYRNMADISAMMGDIEVFTSKQSDDLKDPIRTDCVQLTVDSTDFWWEGQFKHTDIHWETRMIPLSFLPKNLKPVSKLKDENKDEVTKRKTKIIQEIVTNLNQMTLREVDLLNEMILAMRNKKTR